MQGSLQRHAYLFTAAPWRGGAAASRSLLLGDRSPAHSSQQHGEDEEGSQEASQAGATISGSLQGAWQAPWGSDRAHACRHMSTNPVIQQLTAGARQSMQLPSNPFTSKPQRILGPKQVLYRGRGMLFFRFLVRMKVFQLAGAFMVATLFSMAIFSVGGSGAEHQQLDPILAKSSLLHTHTHTHILSHTHIHVHLHRKPPTPGTLPLRPLSPSAAS
jgi:hypothetical protein